MRISGVETMSRAELPRVLSRQEPLHLLFLCSRNQWRSPTAERVWGRHPGVQTRSAGLSPNARRRVSAADLVWADLICVMESEHRKRLLAEFGELLSGKVVQVLDIPDDYRFMDPELVELLEQSVAPLLGL